ncbi:MAG: FHA domain-containing protein [Chloroflexi bacterium]|nr:FHA domain-containing protein [Chloroflexota bacterium]
MLLLRVAIVALLYVFLFSLVRLTQRELRGQAGARRMAPTQGRLVVIDRGASSKSLGQAIPLEPVTRLGRSDENTVVLDDDFVSSQHAMVVLKDGRWWVRDEGSTNGTLVNGSRIRGEAPLEAGDELQLGQIRLRFVPQEH